MDVIDLSLGPLDMQTTVIQINLIPSQAAEFRMPVCDQNHGGVTVTVAGTPSGSFLEALELLFSQIFPRPEFDESV
jgi:hypothetical protein